MNLLQSLKSEFQDLVGLTIVFPNEYKYALEQLCEYLIKREMRTVNERRKHLLAHINAKFNINKENIAAVYAMAALRGTVFNFHEKKLIQKAFDSRDKSAFVASVKKAAKTEGLLSSLCDLFRPSTEEETLNRFRTEVNIPSKLRIDEGARQVGNEILLSAMSAFVFSVADEEIMHEFFDSHYQSASYEKNFWMQLQKLYPQLYSRNRTLDIVSVSQVVADSCGSFEQLRSTLLGQAASSYEQLENHGHLAYWIEPTFIEGRCVTWELVADLMIFAEKHDEVILDKAYFKAKQIEVETLAHIDTIDLKSARFELANEGFTYKDTFVCVPTFDALSGSESILLLFQKNKRDETVVPCPACRSHSVQGNSYSSLGVRSWECKNLLCPDRSKYNRGKRYSFKSLLMQKAIDEDESQIPVESVRKWSKDVQVGCNLNDAIKMLIRHYSLHNDGVSIFGVDAPLETFGRRISIHKRVDLISYPSIKSFLDLHWFKRYGLSTERYEAVEKYNFAKKSLGSLTMIHGESSMVLGNFPNNYFDGAVTSPPYFNAREYSQWPNIYCYLHDMLKIAKECYRVLKPGAVYLYNIFDYFDNERSIVFSAMGEKRIILSAYTVEIFRRVGFELIGSVTWDKGDIEGKRGFNAGNFSPYYQAPFNCWEHVLVFAKPSIDSAKSQVTSLPAVLRAQPVIKMIKGQNTHGHTAPYPLELPNLLRTFLPLHGGRVLDPFGGSGTTARALNGFVDETVCIEKSEEYVELALKLFIRSTEASEKK